MKNSSRLASILSFVLSIYLATCLFIICGNIILYNKHLINSVWAILPDLNVFKVIFYEYMIQVLFFILVVFLLSYYFLKKTRPLYYSLIQSFIGSALYAIYFTLATSWVTYPPPEDIITFALVYFWVSFIFYMAFFYFKRLFMLWRVNKIKLRNKK